jgi:hypothetical protein
MCDSLGRGVRPVGRAESIVHEEVVALCQATRGVRVVRRLARVEARVLENLDPIVGQQLSEPHCHRSHREGGVLALGTAEMRAHRDVLGTALEQELERRQ